MLSKLASKFGNDHLLHLASDRELFTKHGFHMNGKDKQVTTNKTTELMF